MEVVVVHPSFKSVAGAEVVAMHVVRRLLDRGANVRIVTLDRPDLNAAFQSSGVDLRFEASEGRLVFDVRRPPAIHQRFLLARIAWLHREARGAASQADLWVSTYNEANLGSAGLQYVHHPLFASRDLLRAYEIDESSSGVGQRLYDVWVRTLARAIPGSFHKNVTLTNSEFMSRIVREAYGIKSIVLYPAFVADKKVVSPDETRINQMVSIGRISTDKHTIRLVELMAEIYRRTPSLSFVIAGFSTDPAYYSAVRKRAIDLQVPIRFETDLSREGVNHLLKTSRYFLSPKRFEHFGITTVEALSAGALPFVHASGGSVEIVEDERLWYQFAEDLAQTVALFVDSQPLREEVLARLTSRLGRFHVSAFYDGLDLAIERALRARQELRPFSDRQITSSSPRP